MGEHEGIFFYTIGQRHGLGLGGGEPYYVAEKILKTNTLVVARGSDNPALFRKEVEVTDIHSISSDLAGKQKVLARVRYRQPLVPAELQRLSNSNYKLVFGKPVKFVAPGQSSVFYEVVFLAGFRGRRMLGGGIII